MEKWETRIKNEEEEHLKNAEAPFHCLLVLVNGAYYLLMIPNRSSLLLLHITLHRQVILDPMLLRH